MARPPTERGQSAALLSDSTGHGVLSTMMSGVLLGALLAWGLVHWTGVRLLAVPALLAGIAIAWYSIWLRYVRRSPDDVAQPGAGPTEETQ